MSRANSAPAKITIDLSSLVDLPSEVSQTSYDVKAVIDVPLTPLELRPDTDSAADLFRRLEECLGSTAGGDDHREDNYRSQPRF